MRMTSSLPVNRKNYWRKRSNPSSSNFCKNEDLNSSLYAGNVVWQMHRCLAASVPALRLWDTRVGEECGRTATQVCQSELLKKGKGVPCCRDTRSSCCR